MARNVPIAKESVRDEIGLSAAADGDLTGLSKFLGFVQREFLALKFASFPREISMRISALHSDVSKTTEYVDGWQMALKQSGDGDPDGQERGHHT